MINLDAATPTPMHDIKIHSCIEHDTLVCMISVIIIMHYFIAYFLSCETFSNPKADVF